MLVHLVLPDWLDPLELRVPKVHKDLLVQLESRVRTACLEQAELRVLEETLELPEELDLEVCREHRGVLEPRERRDPMESPGARERLDNLDLLELADLSAQPVNQARTGLQDLWELLVSPVSSGYRVPVGLRVRRVDRDPKERRDLLAFREELELLALWVTQGVRVSRECKDLPDLKDSVD